MPSLLRAKTPSSGVERDLVLSQYQAQPAGGTGDGGGSTGSGSSTNGHGERDGEREWEHVL